MPSLANPSFRELSAARVSIAKCQVSVFVGKKIQPEKNCQIQRGYKFQGFKAFVLSTFPFSNVMKLKNVV